MICLLIALLFAVSGVTQVYAAAAASMMQMPASAMETPVPDHDMGCGGSDKASHAACLAMCATAVDILVDQTPIPLAVAMSDLHAAAPVLSPGHVRSPDPPPPKS